MTDEIKKRSYVWNTISGMINAGQSALILIFVSHMYPIEDAGIFSIGYAIALLGMTISKYGQRNYQVTDINGEYSFHTYLRSRGVTVISTILLVSLYVGSQCLSGSYSVDKMMVIILLCLWKQIDSIEDVYYGMYQQKGRLDIGAKRYSERLIFSTILFCCLTFTGISFFVLMIIVVIFSVICAMYLINLDAKDMISNDEKNASMRKSTSKLLKECFNLCISSTLAVYIGNLPKYLIDIYLEDAVQARFGYLMMPAFVIMVLSTIIFQPIIRDMGAAVHDGDVEKLSLFVKRQLVYIGLITGGVLVAGGALGIPVLNVLYHVDLSGYRIELMVLFLGGGFYAISQFMIVPIVSMRKQRDIMVIYLITTLVSAVAGVYFVSKYEIWGASILYFIINVLLSLLLLGDYRFRIRQI